MTPNFKLSEFLFSRVALKNGIDNTPSEEVLKNLQFTAESMELVRKKLNDKVIRITSGFRCKELNKAVDGSSKSQHLTGEAVDFICPQFGTPKQIALILSKHTQELNIDQLICEGTWVHISFSPRPRYEVLTCVGPNKFVKGIV